MRPEDAEDVERVVSVIGQGEGVDDRVEVDDGEHDDEEGEGRAHSREATAAELRQGVVMA